MALMKLICAFLVVVIHAKFSTPGYFAWAQYNIVSEGLCRIAVPFFFFASGYYLAKHMGEENWFTTALASRAKSIVLPAFVMILLFIVLVYGYRLLFVGENWVATMTWKIFAKDLGLDLRVPPLLVPMWYARALFIIVLFSPVLYSMIGKQQRPNATLSLIGIAILCFALRPFSDWAHNDWYMFFNYGISLEGILYFSAGIYLRKYPFSQLSKHRAYIFLASGLGLFAIKALLLYYGYPVLAFRIGFVAIPTTLLGGYFSLPDIKVPKFLETVSFPVYMLHVMILSALGSRPVRDGGVFVATNSLTLYFFHILVGFLGSILVAWILFRFTPKLAEILFGGRMITKEKN